MEHSSAFKQNEVLTRGHNVPGRAGLLEELQGEPGPTAQGPGPGAVRVLPRGVKHHHAGGGDHVRGFSPQGEPACEKT